MARWFLVLGSFLLGLLSGTEGRANEAGWTGRVIDIRTGEPLVGIEVQGGWTGRVDVTESCKTGAEGTFALPYPKHDSPPEQYHLYAWPVRMPDASGYGRPPFLSDYLFYELRQKGTGQVEIKMVPFWAYLKGRVVDADTGAPLAGILVVAARPGRYLMNGSGGYSHAVTNANGEYVMRLPAYGEPWLLSPEGLPEASWIREDMRAEAISDYWLEFNSGESEKRGADYAIVSTLMPDASGARSPMPIPLLSSTQPAIATEVSIRLPKKSSAVTPSRDLVTLTPPRLPGGGGDAVSRLDALIRTLEAALEEARALREDLSKGR